MDLITIGLVVAGYAVAGLFFLRFWRDTGDRLFALFALAFLVLAANRIGVALLAVTWEHGDKLYWVRFAAFALLLIAIIDKNRPRRTTAVSD